jgi:chromosome segregation ATPase
MAKPISVTYDVFAQHADEMVATGDVPSQAKMVARLGGSNSTMGPMLRQWKRERAQALAAGGKVEMQRYIEVDTAVAVVLRRAQAEVRDELREDLDGQVREIDGLTRERDAERAHVAELSSANAVLQSLGDKLSGQVSQLERDVESVRAERADATTALETSRVKLGMASERIAGLEARVAELTPLQHRAEMAERLQATLEAKLAVEHDARGVAEQRVVTLTGSLDAQRDTASKLAAAQSRVFSLEEQVGDLRAQLQLLEKLRSEAEARATKTNRG